MFLLLAVLISAIGQNDASPARDDVVTVSACISGNHLKLQQGTTATVESKLNASEFILEGSKEILRTIRKNHDGHWEEVTGLVKLPPTGASDVHVRQKDLGPKTRITLGSRQSRGEELSAPVRLVVSSYRHLADRCSQL